jgi:hypothetical protein
MPAITIVENFSYTLPSPVVINCFFLFLAELSFRDSVWVLICSVVCPSSISHSLTLSILNSVKVMYTYTTLHTNIENRLIEVNKKYLIHKEEMIQTF